MRKAKMTVDFQNDIVNAFGEKTPLITVSSGYYAIPITKAKQIIIKQHFPATSQVTSTVTNAKSEKQHALKLHCQFAHPDNGKLLQLITNMRPSWSNNKELMVTCRKISN